MTEPAVLTIKYLTAVPLMLEGKAGWRADMMEQFVISALTIELLIEAVLGDFKRLGLLRSLRQSDWYPGLWIVLLVTFPTSSLLQNELVLTATTCSGSPGFVGLMRADWPQTSVDLVMGQL